MVNWDQRLKKWTSIINVHSYQSSNECGLSMLIHAFLIKTTTHYIGVYGVCVNWWYLQRIENGPQLLIAALTVFIIGSGMLWYLQ